MGMACGAGLSRGSARSGQCVGLGLSSDGGSVAAAADGVNIGADEQVGVGTAVGEVACGAAFCCDGGMLESERAGHACVAIGADPDLIGIGGVGHVGRCSVRIMTVRTLDQVVGDIVSIGLGELRLHVGVALIAELRLRGLEEEGVFAGGVNAMAASATEVGFGVRRLEGRGMFCRMALEAHGIDLRGGVLSRREDGGWITAAFDVCFRGAMTGCAGA